MAQSSQTYLMNRRKFFTPVKSWEYGYWWIDSGGQLDTICENERFRFELLSIVILRRARPVRSSGFSRSRRVLWPSKDRTTNNVVQKAA
jgi:hypothetical protein